MPIAHQKQSEIDRSFAETATHVGIIQQALMQYPTGEESFSPSERYPEYRFQHLSGRPNLVYRTLRELLHSMRLDEDRFGTPGWNPLG